MPQIRQELNVGQIRVALTSPTSGVVRDLIRRGVRVQSAARRKCPKNHGTLANSINWKIAGSGPNVRIEVGTNDRRAPWVHNGTGIYGPSHLPITPRHGSVLVFTVRGDKVIVRSVKGQRGVPFLRDALPAARG